MKSGPKLLKRFLISLNMLSLSGKFSVLRSCPSQQKRWSLIIRSMATTSQVADGQIDNDKAIKLINYLYVNHRKKGKDTPNTIKEALGIYDKLTDPPTAETMDNLIKLFFNFGHPDAYASIWEDIRQRQDEIGYAMLMKCCIESHAINMDDCLEVLSWCKASEYTLKIKDSFIAKLIRHCVRAPQNVSALDRIYSLIFEEEVIECSPIFIKTTMINAYSGCNALQKAIDIFNGIDRSERNMVCIGSMMKSYLVHNRYADALAVYDGIGGFGGIGNTESEPNDYCDSMALRACIGCNAKDRGQLVVDRVHRKLREKGKSEMEMNDHVKFSMITFHGHFGDVDEAERLFKTIRNTHCNAMALNSMMSVYLKNGRHHDALELFRRSVDINEVSKVLAIRSCISAEDWNLGKRLHREMKVKPHETKLCSVLIEFFGRCRDVESARSVFDSMEARRVDVVAIGAMMGCFLENGDQKQVLRVYDEAMSGSIFGDRASSAKLIGFHLNKMCLRIALRACSESRNFKKGHEIIVDHGMRDIDAFFGDDVSAEAVQLKHGLIEFYGNSGDIRRARAVYDSIGRSERTLWSVAAIMKALMLNGLHREAMDIYDDIESDGEMQHDAVTHLLGIKAAGKLNDVQKGMAIHEAVSNMEDGQSVEIHNAVITMYSRCGNIERAQSVFDRMDNEKRNIRTFGAMMEGLDRNEKVKECLEIFERINVVDRNVFCYVVALKACTRGMSNGDGQCFEIGRKIYEELKDGVNGKTWMLMETSLRIVLMNLFASNGEMDECLKIFGDPILVKEVSVWNALIDGFGRNGSLEECKEGLDLMENEYGVTPNRKSYVHVLNGCNTAGDVNEAERMWTERITDDNVRYDLNVVTAFIECLIADGRDQEANRVINEYEKYSRHADNTEILRQFLEHRVTLN